MRGRGARRHRHRGPGRRGQDGVMPQTIEALSHAKDSRGSRSSSRSTRSTCPTPSRSGAPQLADHGLIPEDGAAHDLRQRLGRCARGHRQPARPDAATADFLELRANPDKPASGLVIEARLDRQPRADGDHPDPGGHAACRRHRPSPGALSARCGRCSTIAASRSRKRVHRPRSRCWVSDGVPTRDQVNAAEDDKVASRWSSTAGSKSASVSSARSSDSRSRT